MSISWLVEPNQVNSEVYPSLNNISPAMMFQFTPVSPRLLQPAEFVFVRHSPGRSEADLKLSNLLAEWNMLWEAAEARQEYFKTNYPDQVPERLLQSLCQHSDTNFVLVPLCGTTRYTGLAPLYHLLPLQLLRRVGLPAMKSGVWPALVDHPRDDLLPRAFEQRLSRAFMFHVWPLLAPGGRPDDFSASEPLRLLAHNLDFWLPYADLVIRRRLAERGRVPFENDKQRRLLARVKRQLASEGDVSAERPRYGGMLWMGEAEAHDATREIVEVADSAGRLRALIDAVRSHRVVDDFSPRWSCVKEDFERKLYRKRSKIRVSFVELPNTIAVHGPESEVDAQLLWEDLLAFVNAKDRRVVVCLRSGITKATEIAEILGYANHSPVSKALARIRRKASRLLN